MISGSHAFLKDVISSNRQSSSQGVGPALSLFLLPHTQPATKGCSFGLPAALGSAPASPNQLLGQFPEPPKRPCCF